MCCNQNFRCKTIPLCYSSFYLTFPGFIFSLVLNWPFFNLNTGSFFTIWATREGVLTFPWCISVLSHFRHFQLFSTLWTGAHQVPLSMGLSRQDYWKGLPCPPPGDLPYPGIESMSLTSPTLADGFFTTLTTWEALFYDGFCSDTLVSDFATPWTAAHRPPCLSPTPGVYPNPVHWVSDAIQPSHPLSSPSLPAFNLSQHQSLL